MCFFKRLVEGFGVLEKLFPIGGWFRRFWFLFVGFFILLFILIFDWFGIFGFDSWRFSAFFELDRR